MFAFWRRLNRRDLFDAPFPEDYRRVIADNVSLYTRLPQSDRDKLEGLVRILIAEKNFVGVGGLELSETMCVAIAARACLLVLRRAELDDPLYPDLGSVVVYPSGYKAKVKRQDGYVVVEGDERRLGESWRHGTLVLSWKAAQAGAADPHDGHDVVLHEFAHQLDGEQGRMNGTPELPNGERYARWAETMSEEFHRLRSASETGRRTDIDSYGATNPAEFFAVITEEFFERPQSLKRKHPALYDELVGYYRIDPNDPSEVPRRPN